MSNVIKNKRSFIQTKSLTNAPNVTKLPNLNFKVGIVVIVAAFVRLFVLKRIEDFQG